MEDEYLKRIDSRSLALSSRAVGVAIPTSAFGIIAIAARLDRKPRAVQFFIEYLKDKPRTWRHFSNQ
jgi:hypothetical protein